MGLLGKAYGELGYYERSLDVLESAQKFERDAQKKKEWTALIRQIQEQEREKADKEIGGR
jgi:hypothetical protein